MSAIEQSELAVLVRETRRQLALSQVQFAGKLRVFFEGVNCLENGRIKSLPIALKQIELLRHQMEKQDQELPAQYVRKLQR